MNGGERSIRSYTSTQSPPPDERRPVGTPVLIASNHLMERYQRLTADVIRLMRKHSEADSIRG